MYEEGHALPQLIHMWRIIANHKTIFFSYRQQFVAHMVNSLSKLGLANSGAAENKILSMDLAALIISWEEKGAKRGVEDGAGDEEKAPAKKLKSDGGKAVSSPVGADSDKAAASRRDGGGDFRLNKAMMEMLTNFLLRIAMHTADSKEADTQKISERAVVLFRKALQMWGDKITIKGAYMEKFLSLCHDQKARDQAKKKREYKMSRKEAEKEDQQRMGKDEKDQRGSAVSAETLAVGLDLLKALLEVSDKSNFILDNSGTVKWILYPAFAASSKSQGLAVRTKLTAFVVEFCKNYDLVSPPAQLIKSGFFQSLKEQIEWVLIEANSEKRGDSNGLQLSSIGGVSGSGPDDDVFEVGREGGRCSAYFALQIIEEVATLVPSFIACFTSIMIRLAQKLTKDHIHSVALNSRSMSALLNQLEGSGNHRVLGTPTLAIFLEAIASSAGGQPEEKGVKETGSALRSLITIVRLLGRTNIFSKFGEQRKPAFQIMSVLLDKSDCVPLLMTVMGIVGGWLLDERAGLTAKERTSLVWKMMR